MRMDRRSIAETFEIAYFFCHNSALAKSVQRGGSKQYGKRDPPYCPCLVLAFTRRDDSHLNGSKHQGADQSQEECRDDRIEHAPSREAD